MRDLDTNAVRVRGGYSRSHRPETSHKAATDRGRRTGLRCCVDAPGIGTYSTCNAQPLHAQALFVLAWTQTEPVRLGLAGSAGGPNGLSSHRHLTHETHWQGHSFWIVYIPPQMNTSFWTLYNPQASLGAPTRSHSQRLLLMVRESDTLVFF